MSLLGKLQGCVSKLTAADAALGKNYLLLSAQMVHWYFKNKYSFQKPYIFRSLHLIKACLYNAALTLPCKWVDGAPVQEKKK